MRLLIFLKSTKSRSFPFGFFCAIIGLAYFENGSVVIMPSLCSMANSIRMSSFRLIGAGRGFGYRLGNSSFQPLDSLLNSSFMPICKSDVVQRCHGILLTVPQSFLLFRSKGGIFPIKVFFKNFARRFCICTGVECRPGPAGPATRVGFVFV